MNLATNKHSPVKDLHALKYDYTLSEVLKIQEYVEVADSLEAAQRYDAARNNK